MRGSRPGTRFLLSGQAAVFPAPLRTLRKAKTRMASSPWPRRSGVIWRGRGRGAGGIAWRRSEGSATTGSAIRSCFALPTSKSSSPSHGRSKRRSAQARTGPGHACRAASGKTPAFKEEGEVGVQAARTRIGDPTKLKLDQRHLVTAWHIGIPSCCLELDPERIGRISRSQNVLPAYLVLSCEDSPRV